MSSALYYNIVTKVMHLSIFSEQLKEARKRSGLTQKQVADGVGVSEAQYQFYEYGKSEPTAGKLKRLCEVLSISSDVLLGLSDDASAHSPTADPNP